MKRREFSTMIGVGAGIFAFPLRDSMAHHGWSSFDESRPLFLSGKVSSVKWQNPHAELTLQLSTPLALPANPANIRFPAQSASIDGSKLLASAQLPKHRGSWNVELAPLTRMQAWKIEPIKIGDEISFIVFTYKDEAGPKVARAEFLMVGTNVYGLRSSPQA